MNGRSSVELPTSAERNHRHHIYHLESDSTANHQQQLHASSAGVMHSNSQQHTCQALPASGVAPFQLPTSSFARSGSRSPSVSSLNQLTVAAAVVSAADSVSNSNGLPVVSGLPQPPPLPPIFRQIPFSFTAAATLGCAAVGPMATQSQSMSSITSSPSSLLRNGSGHLGHHRAMPCLTLPPSHQFSAASGSDKHHHHSQQQTNFCFHHHSGSGVGVGGTAGGGGMGGGTGGPGTTASSTADNNACRLIEYRGAQVAAFQVDGRELICLPQAFDLFLKHLVGGLHTVYTKLKRLDITPVVCNVEQVRVLRGLGAIQPGVNRCKLISPREFDVLYDDCTNSSARPGRPPKRTSTMSTAEVALEHIKQTKLSGFTDFYSQTRLLADAKKALTGFAGSGPGGASAAAAAAAAVSGFLPYLDFKKSPLFAAAAAAAAAASSCYGYPHHPATAAGTTTQTAPHHPSLTGPTPLLPPPAVGPPAVDSTSHLPAAFVPFGSAAYHAGMMSLAASVHAAQQLRRHQSAVAAVASIRNAADELQRLHTGNGGTPESGSSRPNLEQQEAMVDAENEQLLTSRQTRSLCRTPSLVRRSRSKDDVTGNLGNTILYENNVTKHMTLTSGRLHRSDYLVNAARSRLFQDVDEVDMPLNLEPAFRRQLKAVSRASLRSQSTNSSADSQEQASRDDIIVDDTDGQSVHNDDSADHVERNSSKTYHGNQSQFGAEVSCENARNLNHAADSYGDTSSSEEGKILSRIRMGRSRSSSESHSKVRSRSRSKSEPRDQGLNDGLHEEDNFNILNDTQAEGSIDNRSKSKDSEKHWHSVIPAADLLRDQFLQYLPGVGCVSNTADVDKSLVPVFQTGLSPSSSGYSVEVLLANVQGLLKAVVDGARQREQQADIEKDNLRKKLKRERENRRQLERRLVSVATGVSDRSVTDSFDSALHGFGCNRSNQRICVSQKDGCTPGCECCSPAASDGTENRKPHTLSGFGDEITPTGTAV